MLLQISLAAWAPSLPQDVPKWTRARIQIKGRCTDLMFRRVDEGEKACEHTRGRSCCCGYEPIGERPALSLIYFPSFPELIFPFSLVNFLHGQRTPTIYRNEIYLSGCLRILRTSTKRTIFTSQIPLINSSTACDMPPPNCSDNCAEFVNWWSRTFRDGKKGPCDVVRAWYWFKFNVLNNDTVREYLKKHGFGKVPASNSFLRTYSKGEMFLTRPKAGEIDHQLHQMYWQRPWRTQPTSSATTKARRGFLDVMEGLDESHLSPWLPFEIKRHPLKGLVLIARSNDQEEIFAHVWGTLQWVHPIVIEKSEDKFTIHDAKIEDQGRILVLSGPLAIASHRCRATLEHCMSEEWLENLGNRHVKCLLDGFLKLRSDTKWDIKLRRQDSNMISRYLRRGWIAGNSRI